MKKRIRSDALPGGKADNMPDDLFDPNELQMGMEDESEHTDSPEIRREITKDHLVTNPHYYTEMKKFEHVAQSLVKAGISFQCTGSEIVIACTKIKRAK